jgi:molybdopterin converting factor small subunit
VRLFAAAREAVGTGQVDVDASTVGEALELLRHRSGPTFDDVLAASRIWLNGDTAEITSPVGPGDEIAILPPVSGG